MPINSGRDELSRTLRQLRQDAGLTLVQVAELSGFSIATLSRVETGKSVPTPEQAEAFARASKAPAVVRRRLVRLAGDLRERVTPRSILVRGGAALQRRFKEIETATGHVQSWSPVMVVGLLQTPEYARVVFEEVLPDDQVEKAVVERMKRQELLAAARGPDFTQIITEGALRWCVGSPELMVAQCEKVAQVASQGGRVRVGIIPSGRPARIFPLHGFDLYDERAAIVGTLTGTAFINARADVAAFVAMFERIAALAEFGESATEIAYRIGEDYIRRI